MSFSFTSPISPISPKRILQEATAGSLLNPKGRTSMSVKEKECGLMGLIGLSLIPLGFQSF
ncbi:hypothetical protein, partial [Sphingomonas sp.]|uniref:hypothetical protein n=1 Tax=Sphingomonas sp. TaxID=28214 RepID=UPI0037520675